MKPFDNVAISSGEPRNNADVWIKHGKNLFNAVIEQGGISDLGADNTGNNRLRTLEFIFLKKGTYTLSFTGLEYSGGYLYNTNGTFNKLLWAWTTGNKTFTIENDSLMRFTFRKSDNAEITPDVVKNIQIEVGLEATEYEAPVVDDILVKHNGVYNSVLKKSITTGQEIRTTNILDGKYVYYKRVDLGNLPNSTTKEVDTGLSNVNILKLDGIAKETFGTVIPLPFVIADTTKSVAIVFNTTTNKITITTGTDRTNFSGYANLYYTKN